MKRVLGPPPEPSIEKTSKFELKKLPSHLRFAFLGEYKTLPVILFATLYESQVEATLSILKKRKAVVGWKIFNI